MLGFAWQAKLLQPIAVGSFLAAICCRSFQNNSVMPVIWLLKVRSCRTTLMN